jgi:hypothetical protein
MQDLEHNKEWLKKKQLNGSNKPLKEMSIDTLQYYINTYKKKYNFYLNMGCGSSAPPAEPD